MFTFEDNKLWIAHLLNLPFQEIDTITNIDSSSISCVLKNTHSTCPFCHSTHVYSKGFYKKSFTIPYQHSNIKNIILNIKRFKCQECLHSFSNSTELTPRNFITSYPTIEAIMTSLKKENQTFKSIADNFHVSETTVKRYFDKYYHPLNELMIQCFC
ncbi:transposase family protein [Aerococcaceae bacterium zg-ZUI334]|uniref:transposase n=1 Tax=Aerococcaceae bacterium zg-252 TaxID=2796928 RepID=UPI001BA30586|nr:transposase family protein [Aerococcaceae bacterium zg-ZUI334]